MILQRLTLEEMDAAAKIHRAAFDERLPWLAGLHTPEQDRAYFRERVFTECEVWGAVVDDGVIGFIAFRQGWVDQLYTTPVAQGRGAGSRLLAQAKATFPDLCLWTFQRNAGARAFYEARGFILERLSDGKDNEAKEPDVLYRWLRSPSVFSRSEPTTRPR